ncbi:MAG: LPS export ABC transporter periplasmic protein LptC [Saprospiraceae bacterium]|nr:LPS export ABC transporter periplasmic protein LptC [Saprospiraceae bacterium]
MDEHPRRKFFPVLCWLTLLLPALPACDSALRREAREFTKEDTNVEVAHDVEILYSDSAVVRVRITAPTLLYYVDRDNPRQEFPDGIKVEFLTPTLEVRSVLTAKTAVRQDNSSLVTARDSVVLQTVEQEKLETEELIWNEKTEKVYTEKFVKVTKPGELIYGFGLEANQDFSFWKITVPKGTIKSQQLNQVVD